MVNYVKMSFLYCVYRRDRQWELFYRIAFLFIDYCFSQVQLQYRSFHVYTQTL